MLLRVEKLIVNSLLAMRKLLTLHFSSGGIKQRLYLLQGRT